MLAWDKAVRGEHGGAREGAGRKPAVAAEVPDHDPETGEIKLDNIQLEKPVSDAPTGTSAQAGLRRLEKAASAGDGNAADLLRRVMSLNEKGRPEGRPMAQSPGHRSLWNATRGWTKGRRNASPIWCRHPSNARRECGTWPRPSAGWPHKRRRCHASPGTPGAPHSLPPAAWRSLLRFQPVRSKAGNAADLNQFGMALGCAILQRRASRGTHRSHGRPHSIQVHRLVHHHTPSTFRSRTPGARVRQLDAGHLQGSTDVASEGLNEEGRPRRTAPSPESTPPD